MRKVTNYYIIFTVLGWSILSGCEKAIDGVRPYNERADQELLVNIDGYTAATNGNYALLATQSASETQYAETLMNLSELKGNSIVAITQAYPQNRSDSYAFVHSPSQSYSGAFWRMSYRLIFGANKVIDAIQEEGVNADFDQLKGENYFLRAMAHFNLVRVYGKPYYQNNGENLGVPIVNTSKVDKSFQPKRNTVKEVYASIIADLEKAATLMTKNRANYYASKQAAWALLSRVYLYMGGSEATPNAQYNEKAIEYADKVIASGSFNLLQGTSYKSFFSGDSKANKEIIFSFRHDDVNANKVNEYYGITVLYGISAYQGEYGASPSYMTLLNKNADDLRKNFVKSESDLRAPGVERYSVTKYDYQRVIPNAFSFSANSKSATIYLRLAEMYLNKAEAAIKLGRNAEALTAINVIRVRAGIQPLTETDLSNEGKSAFDAVMDERRLELAWEGHGSYDFFRNGLPMVRDYADYTAQSRTIQPDDKRIISPLPQTELLMNPNLEQNTL